MKARGPGTHHLFGVKEAPRHLATEQDTLQPPPPEVPLCLATQHPDPLILSFAQQLCQSRVAISIIRSTVSVPQGVRYSVTLIFLHGPNVREQ